MSTSCNFESTALKKKKGIILGSVLEEILLARKLKSTIKYVSRFYSHMFVFDQNTSYFRFKKREKFTENIPGLACFPLIFFLRLLVPIILRLTSSEVSNCVFYNKRNLIHKDTSFPPRDNSFISLKVRNGLQYVRKTLHTILMNM